MKSHGVPANSTELETMNINTADDGGNNKPELPRSFSVASDDEVKSSKASLCLTVVLWLFVVYSVITSTYILFATRNSTKTTCSCSVGDVQSALTVLNIDVPTPTTASPTTLPPTTMPSEIPSKQPSLNPSVEPSKSPTMFPSESPSFTPTFEPTLEPTAEPTTEPTTGEPTAPTAYPSNAPTATQWPLAGDFKLSYQSSNHDSWLLCDGLYYDPLVYTELFDVIDYTYGQSGSLFGVPSVGGKTLGIAGGSHSIGSSTGSETFTLTSLHLPAHRHILIADAEGMAADQGWALCTKETTTPASSNTYILSGCDLEPTKWWTGSSGGSGAFDIMQPTTFATNMFIHTGQ